MPVKARDFHVRNTTLLSLRNLIALSGLRLCTILKCELHSMYSLLSIALGGLPLYSNVSHSRLRTIKTTSAT